MLSAISMARMVISWGEPEFNYIVKSMHDRLLEATANMRARFMRSRAAEIPSSLQHAAPSS
jgi:hypothetical protein